MRMASDLTTLSLYLFIYLFNSKDNGGFMAETFTGAGCIVVGFGYPLAPGTLFQQL